MNRGPVVFIAAALCIAACSADGQVIPDDPDFNKQWGLHNTGQRVEGVAGIPGADVAAADAWAIHHGSPSTVVAIVSTGVDPHPEFGSRLLDGRSFIGDLYDSFDVRGTGTHAAGIIAAEANNGLGMAGLHPTATLLPVRVAKAAGSLIITSETVAAEGIRWAVDRGADVVVALLAFPQAHEPLAEAVQYAIDHDVLIIAPTGNDGNNETLFPAAFPGCLAVSGTNNRDGLAAQSNFGAGADLSAPGENIWSTRGNSGYGYRSGASPAAAVVAGAAALVRSYAPHLSQADVRNLLITTADDLGAPGWDEFGAGRLNLLRALENAEPPALRFEHVTPLPVRIPSGGTRTTIRILNGTEELSVETAALYTRFDDGFFQPSALAHLDGDLFRADLPGGTCSSILEYFFQATGSLGTIIHDPIGAPADSYTARVGLEQLLFADDFETDLGWLSLPKGATAAVGAWTRADADGVLAHPPFDMSPGDGRQCYVTGPTGGRPEHFTDVDGGPVILISPVIPLTPGAHDTEVSYGRWFHSTVGETDTLLVEVTRDGGSNWETVETVGHTGAWERRRFFLSEFPELSGEQLRLRFSTADKGNDSLTEAGIDEVRVVAILCSVIRGDGNGDGRVNLPDLESMIACWTGPRSAGLDDACQVHDFDQSGTVDIRDFKGFQTGFAP